MRVSSINNNCKKQVDYINKNNTFKSSVVKKQIPIKNSSDSLSLFNLLGKFAKASLKLCYAKLRYFLVIIFIALPGYISKVKDIHKEYPQITPLEKKFTTLDSAINYSIGRITERLNEDTPREYSVCINAQRNKIISETLGNESRVITCAPLKQLYNRYTTENYNYILLHGHPAESDGSTTTFSFQDFKTFVSSEDCRENYVINNNGNYCKMTKTENYRKPTPEEIKALEDNFDFYFNAAWPHEKTIYNENGEGIFNIIDYPGMHDYWDFTTKKFGIKYETTFGKYGDGNDIYENGYHEAFLNKMFDVE